MWLDWLVFCDCGFQPVCALMEKDKRLMEASWWERLRGKLGLVLMGGAMLNKSLIQSSVEGRGCVPSLLFDLRPNYGNENNGDLLHKVPCAHCYTQCPQPCSRPPPTHTSPETSGHSRASLGQSFLGSLLLSPGSWCAQASVCALQESISQPCVSSGGSVVGLMATASKRAYATPRSAAARAPAPAAGHCWPGPPQEALRHSSVSVSVGSLGSGAHKVCLSPLSMSGGNGVWF